ncbi:MAG: hypothetical protein P4L22_03425 [Candidatus Babeliales bacterium]|nr:hypothetical protein [Candidatus Babeliales bacterium]
MIKNFIILLCFQINCQANLQNYCTAADSKDYNALLNLIDSIHKTNLIQLGEILIFNSGLDQEQIKYLNNLKKVKVYKTEKTSSHMAFSIKQALEIVPYVLWISPDITVLKPLDALFKYIQSNTYFLTTIGDEYTNIGYKHTLEVSPNLMHKFDLQDSSRRWILSCELINSNLMGFSKDIYNDLVLQFYEHSKETTYEQSLITVLAYIQGRKVLRQSHNPQLPIYLDINGEQVAFYLSSSLVFK